MKSEATEYPAEQVPEHLSDEEVEDVLEDWDEGDPSFESVAKGYKLKKEDLKKDILDISDSPDFTEYLRESEGNKRAKRVSYGERMKKASLDEGVAETNRYKLPFEDGSFDIILARSFVPEFFSDIPDKKAEDAFEEMLRVLKSGGKIKFSMRFSDERGADDMTDDEADYDDETMEDLEEGWSEKKKSIKTFEHFLKKLKDRGYDISIKRKLRKNSLVTVTKN